MRLIGLILLLLLTGINATMTFADEALLHKKAAQQFMNTMVRHHHFDKKQLVSILREAKFQPQIIESMDKPFEKKTWDVYKELFLQPDRVQAGINYWSANQKALDRAQREYGVPADIIVAIIGVETLYGKHQGNYRVLDALTTLAFYYPKRAPYFTKELGEFLLLCRERHVAVTEYMGSYAGAMGKPQFMPSSYRSYAVDFTGNGKRDLMHEDSDVIGSIANYFYKHGWKMHGGVAQMASVTGSSYKKLEFNSKVADYNINQIIRAGIRPLGTVSDHPNRVGILELNTSNGQEYWVTYPNFYVITHYNTSPQYALVVYLFAQQLNERWLAEKSHHRSRPFG